MTHEVYKNLSLDVIVIIGNCGHGNLICWLMAITITILKFIYRPICVVVVAVE